jgi:predicted tellurium resistance membrane protein TerC
VFIGAKMLAEEVLLRFLGDRLKYVSLAVVMGLLGVSILASILTARTESGDGKGPDA